MAVTYGNIAGQEPSTVTFRVATVVIPRGSTSEQQEILTIGDPQTSNALARVVAAEPGSSEFGLITRMAGRVLADQNSTVWAVQAAQAGSWTVRSNLSSTSTDNPVSAAQSGAWTVSVSGYSTTAQVSSVGGVVTVQPASTAFATGAGFSFNSSGELKVIDGGSAAAGSTIVTVSTGSVGIAGAYDSSNGLVKIADSANNALRVNVVAGAAGGSTIVSVSTVAGRVAIAGYHQSGSLVNVTDSTNNAINVNVVAGAAGGSTIVTISAQKQAYGAAQTLTITSSGLTSGSARESNAVDNTATLYRDFNIFIQRKGSTASSAYIDYFVYASLGDTTYTDGATGTDAAFTVANRRHSRYLGSLQMSTTPATVSNYFKLSDIFVTMPSKWGLIEVNNSAGTITSSGSELLTKYEGVY